MDQIAWAIQEERRAIKALLQKKRNALITSSSEEPVDALTMLDGIIRELDRQNR
jgi:hypothetical protein